MEEYHDCWEPPSWNEYDFSSDDEPCDGHGDAGLRKSSIASMAPDAARKAIKKDPSILFTPCIDISYLVSRGTVNEEFLLELDKESPGCVDWASASRQMHLSKKTLMAKQDSVDWPAISSSGFYRATARFIELFHKKLDWKSRGLALFLSKEELEDLVFVRHLVPVEKAISGRYLSKEQLAAHQEELRPFLKSLLFCYGPATVEGLEAASLEAMDALAVYFFKECTKQTMQYVPQRLAPLLQVAVSRDPRACAWEDFILECQPTEEYLLQHADLRTFTPKTYATICTRELYKPPLSEEFLRKQAGYLNWGSLMMKQPLPRDLMLSHLHPRGDLSKISKDAARAISIYQRLDVDLIDKYADVFDWFEVCEHQELPEWLLRKHLHRLNWGQVSLYQKITPAFLADYRNNINMEKLSKNVHSKHLCI